MPLWYQLNAAIGIPVGILVSAAMIQRRRTDDCIVDVRPAWQWFVMTLVVMILLAFVPALWIPVLIGLIKPIDGGVFAIWRQNAQEIHFQREQKQAERNEPAMTRWLRG